MVNSTISGYGGATLKRGKASAGVLLLDLDPSPASGLIAKSGYAAAGVDALLSENLSMKLFSYERGHERKAYSVCRLRP
ncbi:hypothetical protein [Bifidobacterium subtile]|uniref:hypothetical protein n=1 Tax=Bifidobacterium subtile TaxID=77635 RepID=UPI0009DECFA3|nr:hypothetical protein [Bifidobacterium subtile]QOL35725.1 hypothetical protein BS3272_07205 [Bifidobacterium subtile]